MEVVLLVNLSFYHAIDRQAHNERIVAGFLAAVRVVVFLQSIP